MSEPPGPCGAGRFCCLWCGHGCSVQLSQGAGLDCLWPHGCSGRRRARPPARLGVLTSFGAAPRSPPVPSGPSGALLTGGACRSGVSRPRRPRVPQPGLRSLRYPPYRRCLWFWCVRAPTPPMGAAARPCGLSSAFHAGGASGSGVSGQASPPPTGAAAWTSGASSTAASGYDVRLRVSSRSPAWPHRRVYAPIRVPVKEISPQLGALVRGMVLQ